MADESIFSGGEQTNEPNTETQPDLTKILPDSLRELVGEGKKYGSVVKALESIPHAQEHISQLERELAELRGKADSASSRQEVYNAVKELLEAERQTPKSGKVDEDSIAALLDRKLAEREKQQRVASNVTTVKKALVEKFGDRADEVYQTKAKELGVSVGFLNDVVAASPSAAFELFGMKNNSAPVRTGITSSVNSEALKTTTAAKPTKSIMGGASTSDMINAWRAAKPSE